MKLVLEIWNICKEHLLVGDLDQLVLLEKLLKEKDYGGEKKAEKSKKRLLKQINIEIYKRHDTAIWKI